MPRSPRAPRSLARRLLVPSTLVFGALISVSARAEEARAPEMIEGFFSASSPLEIRLEAPWRKLFSKESRADPVESPGSLAYAESGGRTVTLPVRVKPRGNWRLKHCATPPLTVKLEPTETDGTLFAGMTRLYLTTQCQPGNKYLQHLYQEYLVYEIYRLLTDEALRARRLIVDYRESEAKRRSRTGHAFVVENIDLAAARMGREWIDPPVGVATPLDAEAAARFALFQYMIGHTDWSIARGRDERCCHNAALLAPIGAGRPLVPVPFDFDASGLVNTGDTRPSKFLPIRSARQRLYRGHCTYNDRLLEAVESFNAVRADIEHLVDQDPLLSPGYRGSVRRYLESFYQEINDPQRLEQNLLSRCRS